MNNTLKISLSYFLLFAFLLLANSCSKESEYFDSINDYILGLQYDKASLLKVRSISGAIQRTKLGDIDVNTNPVQGKYLDCTGENFRLDRNFDNISILRPTNGVIYPGALVYADEDLWKGTPRPLTLDRSKMDLRIDLPGMRSEGNIEVKDISNTEVQAKLDEALEWWNDNAYEEGYVNASASEYETTEVYSSVQLGLDVGMNVEWATGSVSSQLEYDRSSEKRVAVLVFKQVFYNVTMDTPGDPADVFSNDVTLSSAQAAFDESAPPAYISNVSYGRIVMFRMEVENVSESVDLEAVMNYAGGVSVDTDINTEYDAILERSSIKVVTIGGDAEVTSQAVTAKGFNAFNEILTGENAVYSRNNPGVPIAYTVKFLKDNTLAKMGYTTDYSIEDCVSKFFNHRTILVKNKFKHRNIRAKIFYTSSLGTQHSYDWVTIKDETFEGKYLTDVPNGAYDVRLNIEKYKAFDGWTEFEEFTINHVDSAAKACYSAYEVGNTEKCTRCVDE